MDNNIKRCPFCGGPAGLNAKYTRKYNTYFVFVQCLICNAQARTFSDEQNPAEVDWKDGPSKCAIDAWNMRANDRD